MTERRVVTSSCREGEAEEQGSLLRARNMFGERRRVAECLDPSVPQTSLTHRFLQFFAGVVRPHERATIHEPW